MPVPPLSPEALRRRDVPGQLTQILVDLEAGKFRVNVHSEDVERVGGHVRAIGVMLYLGLLAAGLTAGGLFVLGARGETWVGVGALVAAALVSASAATYHVATLRMRKISLRRLLKR